MKNPFKKSSAVDTLVNVGVGGAANVAIDYVVNSVEVLAGLDSKIINGIKIALGAVGGSITSNKIVRAAVDGIAVVGASNLVSELVNGTSSTEAAAGIPANTIGRIRVGQRGFRRASKVSGIDSCMGK